MNGKKKKDIRLGLRLTAAVLALICAVLAFPACSDGQGGEEAPVQTTEGPAEATTEAPPEAINFADGTYTVIRSENAADGMVKSAANFNKKIKDLTGAKFLISEDWVRDQKENVVSEKPEILLGSTNRLETAQVLAELPEHSYTARLAGNKLVIVGTDDNMTVQALYEFEKRILNNPAHCGKETLLFSADDAFTVECGKPVQVSEMLKNGRSITADAHEVLHCEPSGVYTVSQGAASDGKYAYFLLRTPEDGYAVIRKYDLAEKTLVGESEPVYVFHGNDMTYDKAKNRLVLSHGSSEGKILTTMDADTLKVLEEKVNITQGSGAITYSVATGKFAISQGGSTLHIFTGDLKWIESFSRITDTGYTAQGMGSDEDYVYFPMSGSSDNILQVYGWDGRYAGIIHIPVKLESESMFWVNDTYYISFYTGRNGAFLYQVDFRMIYQ